MTVSISAAEIEQAEAETCADFEAAASPRAQAALGTRALRVGGGVALAIPKDSSGFWSKVLGLGFDEPLSVALMERVAGFYRDQGMSSVLLQFAPEVLPADWADICEKVNIAETGSSWMKLVGDIGPIVEAATERGGAAAYLGPGLRVGPVPADRARDWAAAMWEVFGFPVEHQIEMAEGVVGRPGWQPFAVFEGEEIVAIASLHLHGQVGHLFGGGTLPHARGRGAQSALIAARALAAREAGCGWLVAETGAERPGEHNPSLHNLLRAGLSVRYERRNWRWRA
jgi:GNAT superfamily N-acetyltransferase